jgi:uncharacterized surface protein with fasciclin (FAS1) repeats
LVRFTVIALAVLASLVATVPARAQCPGPGCPADPDPGAIFDFDDPLQLAWAGEDQAATFGAELGQALQDPAPLTVLRPTLSAFKAVGPELIQGARLAGYILDAMDCALIDGAETPDQLAERARANGGSVVLASRGGCLLTVTIDGGLKITDQNGRTANVIASDTSSPDHPIYDLDTVLFPPFGVVS